MEENLAVEMPADPAAQRLHDLLRLVAETVSALEHECLALKSALQEHTLAAAQKQGN